MILSAELSERIVVVAHSYIGREYDWHLFDCVHFVIAVYRQVGIEIPRFGSKGYPPSDFHLTAEEFYQMPLGQTVFFKRRASTSDRIWTHVAIIASPTELIHCSRHNGNGVRVTTKAEFLEIYVLAQKWK